MTRLFSGNMTINTTTKNERTVKVWHVVVALVFGIFIRRRKRKSKPELQIPQENSTHENVELNKMNNEKASNNYLLTRLKNMKMHQPRII